MKNSSKYIVVYSSQDTDANFFGFCAMEKAESSTYMKCVKVLEENEICFDVMSESIPYDADDFSVIKVDANEAEKLFDIFSVAADDEKVGVFPDAINDAYDNELMK